MFGGDIISSEIPIVLIKKYIWIIWALGLNSCRAIRKRFHRFSEKLCLSKRKAGRKVFCENLVQWNCITQTYVVWGIALIQIVYMQCVVHDCFKSGSCMQTWSESMSDAAYCELLMIGEAFCLYRVYQYTQLNSKWCIELFLYVFYQCLTMHGWVSHLIQLASIPLKIRKLLLNE